ncbi:hypothetical protein NP493_1749g00066 [Ridgeia piscesae]|uniref:Uncharacterized protein n=1 Tax=Ridgeia piscesae TaxID=27915 RepID=A0AAD9JTH9_RIDPI|nr:hypothetical protein NP493_1749g00066 [Ridgeia piscesae]
MATPCSDGCDLAFEKCENDCITSLWSWLAVKVIMCKLHCKIDTKDCHVLCLDEYLP